MPRRTRPSIRKHYFKISTKDLIKRDRVCFSCSKPVSINAADRTNIDAYAFGHVIKTPKLIHRDCKIQENF